MVRGNTRFISSVVNYRFSTNIKCPEAMIGDCLKSDNFTCEIIINNLTCDVRLSVLSVPEIFIEHCTLYNKIHYYY